jgi:radical S-adenosyl methionine domain-containing protein 2
MAAAAGAVFWVSIFPTLISNTTTLITLGTTLIATSIAYLFLSNPTLSRRLHMLFRQHILKHTIPISVNYHFTRKCNAECKFCFHTELTSHVEPLSNAKAALHLLHTSGMQKLNFAGGEPFLYPKHLGELCRYAKAELKLQSVSIVTNGTKVTEKWLEHYGHYIDILAVSCDSFHAETNAAIGRADRRSGKAFDNVERLFRIRGWCRELGIKFKLNTVVCRLNWDEDMVGVVTRLAPFRWKVFQVLLVDGENESEERKRDARSMMVTDAQFETFCLRHRGVEGFTPESNEMMVSSYLVSQVAIVISFFFLFRGCFCFANNGFRYWTNI